MKKSEQQYADEGVIPPSVTKSSPLLKAIQAIVRNESNEHRIIKLQKAEPSKLKGALESFFLSKHKLVAGQVKEGWKDRTLGFDNINKLRLSQNLTLDDDRQKVFSECEDEMYACAATALREYLNTYDTLSLSEKHELADFLDHITTRDLYEKMKTSLLVHQGKCSPKGSVILLKRKIQRESFDRELVACFLDEKAGTEKGLQERDKQTYHQLMNFLLLKCKEDINSLDELVEKMGSCESPVDQLAWVLAAPSNVRNLDKVTMKFSYLRMLSILNWIEDKIEKQGTPLSEFIRSIINAKPERSLDELETKLEDKNNEERKKLLFLNRKLWKSDKNIVKHPLLACHLQKNSLIKLNKREVYSFSPVFIYKDQYDYVTLSLGQKWDKWSSLFKTINEEGYIPFESKSLNDWNLAGYWWVVHGDSDPFERLKANKVMVQWLVENIFQEQDKKLFNDHCVSLLSSLFMMEGDPGDYFREKLLTFQERINWEKPIKKGRSLFYWANYHGDIDLLEAFHKMLTEKPGFNLEKMDWSQNLELDEPSLLYLVFYNNFSNREFRQLCYEAAYKKYMSKRELKGSQLVDFQLNEPWPPFLHLLYNLLSHARWDDDKKKEQKIINSVTTNKKNFIKHIDWFKTYGSTSEKEISLLRLVTEAQLRMPNPKHLSLLKAWINHTKNIKGPGKDYWVSKHGGKYVPMLLLAMILAARKYDFSLLKAWISSFELDNLEKKGDFGASIMYNMGDFWREIIEEQPKRTGISTSFLYVFELLQFWSFFEGLSNDAVPAGLLEFQLKEIRNLQRVVFDVQSSDKDKIWIIDIFCQGQRLPELYPSFFHLALFAESYNVAKVQETHTIIIETVLKSDLHPSFEINWYSAMWVLNRFNGGEFLKTNSSIFDLLLQSSRDTDKEQYIEFWMKADSESIFTDAWYEMRIDGLGGFPGREFQMSLSPLLKSMKYFQDYPDREGPLQKWMTYFNENKDAELKKLKEAILVDGKDPESVHVFRENQQKITDIYDFCCDEIEALKKAKIDLFSPKALQLNAVRIYIKCLSVEITPVVSRPRVAGHVLGQTLFDHRADETVENVLKKPETGAQTKGP